MPIVVGISLRTAGKLYYFDPVTERYLLGEKVIVETARGMELGIVKLTPHEVGDEQIVPPLKSVIRRATAADLSRNALNREREEYAVTVCKRLVNKLSLPMRLIDAQYTLDGSHVLIHFLAENRVDFRELVRELARELHTRIELRQVGVRDEAKLLGGYGICGRKLCCSSFLSDFAPVAISMAKDQGLALNPQKISGSCGRLMCCLAYECDQYRHEKAELPRMNSSITTPQGVGRVTKLNVLSHQVEVTLPDSPPAWFTLDELTPVQPAARCCAEEGKPCGTCHSTDGEEDGIMIAVEGALLVEDVRTTVDDGGAVKSADEFQPSRSRSRRRRKKPATGETAGAASQEARPASPAPTAAENHRGKRPRRRKPRPANADGTPVTTSAENRPPDGDAANVPPGRYRPRRRRRPNTQGQATPQQ